MNATYVGFGPLINLRQFSGRTMLLSDRIAAARQHLGEMFAAGELRVLPEDTQLHLKALELFLLGAADETRESENGI
jgi:hypothetical protein